MNDGRDLDPEIRRFIRTIGEQVADLALRDGEGLAGERRRAEIARTPWRQGGPVMAETRELEAPTRHGAVRIRVHRPSRDVLPGLVYLHGGGWTLFSIDTHDRVMREYAARAGCCVIGVDYALSPERRFPVALEQVVDLLDWLALNAADTHIDPERLAIGGDSAGANLSVATCLIRRDLGLTPLPRGMLLNYGAYAAQCSAESCRRYGGPEYMLGCEEMDGYWRNYMRGHEDAANPLVCPLLARLDGLPGAFLAIAECDILAEQNLRMAKRLQEAGVPVLSAVYPGASHSFIEAMSIAAVSDRALADGSAWLHDTLRPPGASRRDGAMA